MMKFFVLVLWVWVFPLVLMAQGGDLPLKIHVHGDSSFFAKEIKYTPIYTRTEELKQIFRKLKIDMAEVGYLASELKILKSDSSGTTADLNTGKQYRWARLNPGNVDEGWLSRIGYQARDFKDKPFNYKQVGQIMEKILSYAENNGYPFAELRLKNLELERESSITATLDINKGEKIVWDTIAVIGEGDSSISRDFLAAYLGIKKGRPYNESVARKIGARLKELLYLNITIAPEIVFTKTHASLRVGLELQKASRLTGVLGLAPNSTKNNKFLLTGEVEMAFLNVTGRGIELDFSGRNFLTGATQVNIGVQYPYILASPIGISESFSLLRYDTAYYILDNAASLNYYFSGASYVRFIYNYNATKLLNADYYALNKLSPPYLDITTEWYGLGLNKEALDYKFNPRKGFVLKMEGSVGNKRVFKNNRLDNTLYDSLRLKKIIYRITGDIGGFVPIGGRSTIHMGVETGILLDDELFDNQLFRIGGLRTLRGFDEGSILAIKYFIPRLEYRFLTDANSNLQIFTNAAWYERKVHNFYASDFPIGMGAGYNYLTKVGLFSISFAVGKQQHSPFDFNAAKLHIGYLNRF